MNYNPHFLANPAFILGFFLNFVVDVISIYVFHLPRKLRIEAIKNLDIKKKKKINESYKI